MFCVPQNKALRRLLEGRVAICLQRPGLSAILRAAMPPQDALELVHTFSFQADEAAV